MSDLTTGYTWANGSTVTADRLNTAIEDATLAPAAISGKTAKTTVVDADELLIWDSATSALKRMTRENLLGLLTAGTVHGQTAKTSLVDADEFLIWDSAASALKNITKADLTAQVQPAGTVLQVVEGSYLANSNLTAQIPLDDTIPQSDEGTQIISQAITIGSASNSVLAMISFFGTPNASSTLVVALFRGAGASAIFGASQSANTVNNTAVMQSFLDSPATTGSVTYAVRVGPNTATTWRINGSPTARYFGGVAKATLTLMEIKG